MKIDIDGRTLSYRRCGKGHPILFLHAFPFSRLMWEDQLLAVAPTHTGVALDLPGFGGSTALPEASTTIAAYAEAAEAIMKKVAPDEPWILCGLSMGGYVAFEIVRRANFALRGLILCDTRAVADSPEQRAVRLQMIEKVRSGGAAMVAELQLSKMLTTGCDPEIRAQVDHWMRRAPAEGIMGALGAMANRLDSRETLKTIKAPVLVIAGANDTVAPPAEMKQFAETIENATFAVIPDASHISNVERPADFNELLIEWLYEIDPPAEDENGEFDYENEEGGVDDDSGSNDSGAEADAPYGEDPDEEF
ncbi:MAG: alpha/beta fold hydrolase [Planctomycetes bacterium]|nr:alpha/beta fold hydrolase [Planctomycetota bacterium]